MKKIKLIALLAALVVGLAGYLFLQELGKPAETPRTAVVVAAMDIPENTKITEEMVTIRQIATEAVLPNYLRETKQAVGMVASGEIFAGEQLVSNRMVPTGTNTDQNNTLAYRVEEGMRAITISVGATSGLVNMIKPGNRVDVLLNYSYEEEKEDEEQTAPTTYITENGEIVSMTQDAEPEAETVAATRFILQNVQVLAVGSEMSKNGAEEYTTVTLEVTPEEALKLSFSEWTGSLRLIMRSSLDYEVVEEEDYTQDTLRGVEEEEKP